MMKISILCFNFNSSHFLSFEQFKKDTAQNWEILLKIQNSRFVKVSDDQITWLEILLITLINSDILRNHNNLAHLPLFFWNYLVVSKYKWKISQISFAFSEYLNLIYSIRFLNFSKKKCESLSITNLSVLWVPYSTIIKRDSSERTVM